jgi:hypothetical protein
VAPAAPRLIGRGDLLAALDRAAASKVTIISAPAGSGKTSLLRAWADRPGQPHRLAVVQVQRDQHDDQQFWLALVSVIRQAFGTTCNSEPPAATPDFNAPAMAGRVLSELTEADGDITLVVDDLHELTSPEALAQLTPPGPSPGLPIGDYVRFFAGEGDSRDPPVRPGPGSQAAESAGPAPRGWRRLVGRRRWRGCRRDEPGSEFPG